MPSQNVSKQATRTTSDRIAVVFDFDETLTPRDSFAYLLEQLGKDVDDIKKDYVESLEEKSWETYLARAYYLCQLSKKEQKLTRDFLAKTEEKIPLHEGTQTLFKRLQSLIHSIDSDIELEFYLISGGFVDIARNTSIAKDFKRMWGCEFHYTDEGQVDFIKMQMTHVAKTRYLYYLSKGLEFDNSTDLVYQYDTTDKSNLHVPLDQVVYVGDGASDIPCFEVMQRYGGTAIGIYSEEAKEKENWEYLSEVAQDQRLSNLLSPGYEEDSELARSLSLAVESIAKRICLRKIGQS